MKERTKFLLILAMFAACWFLPIGSERFWSAMRESLSLVTWYAQDHVLLCLIPAFFIAGAISVFVSQGAVMTYLGPKANKTLAYGVAAVSGTILAVCSCTVLPLFSSIHKRDAGLGPATAFLYSGPAIHVLAMILTARILGPELGIAREVGAIFFAVMIGVLMHLIFRKEEAARQAAGPVVMPDKEKGRALWKNGIYFAAMIGGTERGLIPNSWIAQAVGGNSLQANLFASVVGAFMYFATLTEVPLLEGLIKSGMSKGPALALLLAGPALALLLAGPALSLPSMLVIRSVMGTKKTVVFVGLVIILSTIAGMAYGAFF